MERDICNYTTERVFICNSLGSSLGILFRRLKYDDGRVEYSTVIRWPKFDSVNTGYDIPGCDLSSRSAVYKHGDVNPYLQIEGTRDMMLSIGLDMEFDPWAYMIESGCKLTGGFTVKKFEGDTYAHEIRLTDSQSKAIALKEASLKEYSLAMKIMVSEPNKYIALISMSEAFHTLYCAYLAFKGVPYDDSMSVDELFILGIDNDMLVSNIPSIKQKQLVEWKYATPDTYEALPDKDVFFTYSLYYADLYQWLSRLIYKQ